MARTPRIVVPGQPLHLIQRGNNRQPTFYADEDYRFYLECLYDAASYHGCAVHAYVLMTNHVHLLLTPFSPQAVSRCMRGRGPAIRALRQSSVPAQWHIMGGAF